MAQLPRQVDEQLAQQVLPGIHDGNEYYSVAGSDESMQHPIMWLVRLFEGKDWPKLGNRRWAFPTQWENEGKTKTVKVLLNMTALIHRTGKVVTGDSGFCVAAGVTALHEKGSNDQFVIKKRRYWLKHVPGDLVDAHMAGQRLGETETYVQESSKERTMSTRRIGMFFRY